MIEGRTNLGMRLYCDLQAIRKRISSAHLEVSVRHELRARAKNAANGVGAHLQPRTPQPVGRLKQPRLPQITFIN